MQRIALLLALLSFGALAQPCKLVTRSERIGSGAVVYNVVGSGPAVLLLHGLREAGRVESLPAKRIDRERAQRVLRRQPDVQRVDATPAEALHERDPVVETIVTHHVEVGGDDRAPFGVLGHERRPQQAQRRTTEHTHPGAADDRVAAGLGVFYAQWVIGA